MVPMDTPVVVDKFVTAPPVILATFDAFKALLGVVKFTENPNEHVTGTVDVQIEPLTSDNSYDAPPSYNGDGKTNVSTVLLDTYMNAVARGTLHCMRTGLAPASAGDTYPVNTSNANDLLGWHNELAAVWLAVKFHCCEDDCRRKVVQSV